MDNAKLTLKQVKVLFYHMNDPKFGSSITIDATEPAIADSIEQWISSNGIKMKLKEYTDKEGKTTKQATFKLASFVEIHDTEDKATVAPITFGSTVSLIATAYDYNNNFGAGRTASVKKIRINKVATTKSSDEFAELQ